MDRITLIRPDDWHLHLRDGEALATTVPHAAARFGRAIVMPNLRPPVTTVAAAEAYRRRILAARPPGAAFEPLMTLYLTDTTPPEEIACAAASGLVRAVKLYPAGATTHAEAGVTDPLRLDPVLEAMAAHDLPLLVHGEVVDPEVDVFDREAVFIDRVLGPLVERHPRLRVVLEHVTTRHGVAFVRAARPGVAATITVHHLLLNRNDLLVGGIRPHHYCLPVPKREADRLALLEAAVGGDPRFFLGTDSAPHPRSAKESACGCAGVYTAHAAVELLAEVFEAAGALHRLEAFAARHGAAFHGLAPHPDTITLVRDPWPVPQRYPFPDGGLVPLRAGGTVAWRLAA
ncbi:dihydroorotase [Inmirania thermothiophila]|nr:dihydroorotase [Inmirania thermothiophila]